MFSKMLIGLLLVVSSALATGNRGVLTGSENPPIGVATAMMAGWYDWVALKISGAAGDVVIATTFGANMTMIGVINQNTAAGCIIVKTINSPDAAITIPLDASEKLWPMPEIKTIVKTGTSDSLLILLQRKY